MSVSVVIPNWNGLQLNLLPRIFADLRDQTCPPAEIILADNGSTDGSVPWAQERGAQIVRFDTNQGFAVAVNSGVRAAQSEFVAVLNNDVRLARDWLAVISSTISETNASFAVGKVLCADNPDIIDGTYDALSCGATAWRCGSGSPDTALWARSKRIQFPPFTAVLLRRQDFLNVGGLDETFGSYLEDVEFGLRCASKGYSGTYIPAAVSYHKGSGTLGRWHPRTTRQIARNQLLIVSRHYSPRMLRRFGWKIAVGQILWGFVAARHGAGIPWILGKVEGLKLFRATRDQSADRLMEVLLASESEIRELQGHSRADLYWRLYFSLT